MAIHLAMLAKTVHGRVTGFVPLDWRRGIFVFCFHVVVGMRYRTYY